MRRLLGFHVHLSMSASQRSTWIRIARDYGISDIWSLFLDKMIAKIGIAWAFRSLGFIVLGLGVPAAMLLRERTRRASPSLEL